MAVWIWVRKFENDRGGVSRGADRLCGGAETRGARTPPAVVGPFRIAAPRKLRRRYPQSGVNRRGVVEHFVSVQSCGEGSVVHVDQVSKRFRRGQLHDALAGLHSSKSKIVEQSSRIRYSASPDRRFRKGGRAVRQPRPIGYLDRWRDSPQLLVERRHRVQQRPVPVLSEHAHIIEHRGKEDSRGHVPLA